MAILLELTPQEEADARARAESEGISLTDLFRRYLRTSPEKSFGDIVALLRQDVYPFQSGSRHRGLLTSHA
jgi:hypothetical protein